MTRRDSLIGSLACLAACSSPDPDTGLMALIGGLAIDPGGETVPNSVIVIQGSHIKQVGPLADVGVPSGAEKWNLADRFVLPAPIEIGQGVHMAKTDSLDEARIALIRTPPAVEGIVSDADTLPDALVRGFYAADTVVVPRLTRLEQTPDRLERGLRHVQTLIAARVRVASFAGVGAMNEWRLLSRAGLTPRQVIESATVNAARAARVRDSLGSLRHTFRANLWVLKQNPLVNIENMNTVESILTDGTWQKNPGASK